MTKYKLIIDHHACWGCKTCEVACKQENQAPEGIKLIEVTEEGPAQLEGKLDFVYRVNLCRHCDAPPCAEACPVEAIISREDGLVILDGALCTGCGLCVEACPYKTISLDERAGRAQKCNGCVHRVEKGLFPACADNVCPAHCLYFGPVDRVEQMMARKTLLWERLAADPKR